MGRDTAIFQFLQTRFSIQKSRKCVYLGPGAKNQKNKGTLSSQTFKVEEKKVLLYSSFLALWPRYNPFIAIQNFEKILHV